MQQPASVCTITKQIKVVYDLFIQTQTDNAATILPSSEKQTNSQTILWKITPIHYMQIFQIQKDREKNSVLDKISTVPQILMINP